MPRSADTAAHRKCSCNQGLKRKRRYARCSRARVVVGTRVSVSSDAIASGGEKGVERDAQRVKDSR